MQIRLKNLRLRTYIGIEDWEQEKRQDVVVNATIEFDGTAAAASDRIEDTFNYKSLTKRFIDFVESNRFGLLEHLTDRLAEMIMEDPRAVACTVEVDKPHALRFADSVSVSVDKRRS
jgi:D-erythro-7,8-dihydroneopterin triphosphate epimerase